MKNKALEIVAFTAFCYSVIMIVFSIIFPQFLLRGWNIDYTCGNKISDKGCLSCGSSRFKEGRPKNTNIEVYLDFYIAGCSGGGCLYKFSDTNEIIISGRYFNDPLTPSNIAYSHLLQRDGENLIIDKKIILKKNEEWKDIKTLPSGNPWLVKEEKFIVVNRGIVNCAWDCETKNIVSYGPTLIIDGSVGTYYSRSFIGCLLSITSGLIFIISVGLLIYNHKCKQEKLRV